MQRDRQYLQKEQKKRRKAECKSVIIERGKALADTRRSMRMGRDLDCLHNTQGKEKEKCSSHTQSAVTTDRKMKKASTASKERKKKFSED